MPLSRKIPILDLRPQIDALMPELRAAFERVLRSGQFILGPEVHAFEAACAHYLGVQHAIGLNSGTDALFIALRTLGIGPGDEVITSPFTFFATGEAISHVGATPVFVDICRDSFNIDPDRVEAAVTSRTRAIIPVHLFGRPCEMDRLLEIAARYQLKVVEDCAQSFGATWRERKTGSMGEIGCFSFFPTKNLSAFGDGGLFTTNDDGLAAAARMLRAHGSRRKYHNETIGYNSRLDELQAALLRVKLPHIDSWNQARRRVAKQYQELLSDIPWMEIPAVVDGHVFHQYTVRIQDGVRDVIVQALSEAGIGTMIYYPVPLHQMVLYLQTHAMVRCPIAEQAAKEVLSLPIWPELQDVKPIADVLRALSPNKLGL